jgi:hypothetical protein
MACHFLVILRHLQVADASEEKKTGDPMNDAASRPFNNRLRSARSRQKMSVAKPSITLADQPKRRNPTVATQFKG